MGGRGNCNIKYSQKYHFQWNNLFFEKHISVEKLCSHQIASKLYVSMFRYLKGKCWSLYIYEHECLQLMAQFLYFTDAGFDWF